MNRMLILTFQNILASTGYVPMNMLKILPKAPKFMKAVQDGKIVVKAHENATPFSLQQIMLLDRGWFIQVLSKGYERIDPGRNFHLIEALKELEEAINNEENSPGLISTDHAS